MTSQTRDASWPPADFEAVYADLVRFLARRTGCTDQARELAHDTWLKLAATAPSTEVRHGPAYLFGAAQHLAIDHVRRDVRQGRLMDDVALLGETATANVSDQLAHRQAIQAIDRALEGLPPRTRDAFLAHRLDGTGHDDLASRYGVSRSTIERDLQRAQAQVQAAIERWSGRKVDGRRRRALGALLGVAGLMGGSGVLWSVWQHQVPTWQHAYATPRGRVARYLLPDGSGVTLDADSQLEIVFRGRSRRVQLVRGGAFFDVARDVDRPFTVDTPAAQVTVLGTRFAVELEQAGATSVSVAHGRVRVNAAGDARSSLELAAGESARIDRGHEVQRQAPRQDMVAPWRDGWLGFTRQPLGEVVDRLNRYRADPVEVDPAVAAVPVSGEVRLARLDEWLRLLPTVAPVRLRRLDDGRQRVVAR